MEAIQIAIVPLAIALIVGVSAYVSFFGRSGINQAREYSRRVHEDDACRLSMILDMVSKAQSYSFVNKIAFGGSIVFGSLVVIYPATTSFVKSLSEAEGFVATIHTAIAGLAAVSFTVYKHYKNQQLSTENLLRFAAYSDRNSVDNQAILDRIVDQMATIDTGYPFHNTARPSTDPSQAPRPSTDPSPESSGTS